jgi:hypothetical protein
VVFVVEADQRAAKAQSDEGIDGVSATQEAIRREVGGFAGKCFVKRDEGCVGKTANDVGVEPATDWVAQKTTDRAADFGK